MLVGTDYWVSVTVLMWEETGIPEGNSPRACFINIAYIQYYRNSSLKLSVTKSYCFMNILLTNILQIFHVNLQELYPSHNYLQHRTRHCYRLL